MNSKVVFLGARVLLGLMFAIFGLNKFLQFMPTPPLPPEAGDFMGGLAQAGYFFPMLAVSEILAGVLLLVGVFVPLALLILAPIVLQILAFHFVLAPAGSLMGIVALVLGLIVAWDYKENFKPLFRKHM